MSLLKNYNNTIVSCYIGYIVQAIVNNFAPLLFLTFQSQYDISLDKITMLVTINFGVQLLVDLISAKVVDKIGWRAAMVTAHIFATLGIAGLAFLPELFADEFYGLMIAVMLYAVGGGLLEVCVSPIVVACPPKRKATRSNWKMPMLPQLSPPTMARIRAILSRNIRYAASSKLNCRS